MTAQDELTESMKNATKERIAKSINLAWEMAFELTIERLTEDRPPEETQEEMEERYLNKINARCKEVLGDENDGWFWKSFNFFGENLLGLIQKGMLRDRINKN